MSGQLALMIRAKTMRFAAVTGNTALYPENDGVRISFCLDSNLECNLKFRLDWNTKTL